MKRQDEEGAESHLSFRGQRMWREDNREIRTKQDGKMRGNSFNFRGQYIVGRAEDSI